MLDLPRITCLLLLGCALSCNRQHAADTDSTGDVPSASGKIELDVHAYQVTGPGVCPAVFQITARILVRAPMKLQYRFLRSDGVRLPTEGLQLDQTAVDRGDVRTVATEWRLDKAYAGWAGIEILQPEHVVSRRNLRLFCN